MLLTILASSTDGVMDTIIIVSIVDEERSEEQPSFGVIFCTITTTTSWVVGCLHACHAYILMAEKVAQITGGKAGRGELYCITIYLRKKNNTKELSCGSWEGVFHGEIQPAASRKYPVLLKNR